MQRNQSYNNLLYGKDKSIIKMFYSKIEKDRMRNYIYRNLTSRN